MAARSIGCAACRNAVFKSRKVSLWVVSDHFALASRVRFGSDSDQIAASQQVTQWAVSGRCTEQAASLDHEKLNGATSC